MNPNDASAQVYDIVRLPLKPQEVTDAEISLINFQIQSPAEILDIGGGTGRHAIPLAEQGNKVTVLDSSIGMLQELQGKRLKALDVGKNIEIIQSDVNTYQLLPNHYSLIMLMWNTFNEVALSETDALTLLTKCKNALKPNDKILINIDDASKVDPEHFDFKTTYSKDSLNYKLEWRTVSFDKETYTSSSQEDIEVTDEKGNVVNKFSNIIPQRYWRINELKKLFKKVRLRYEILGIKLNSELYILLS